MKSNSIYQVTSNQHLEPSNRHKSIEPHSDKAIYLNPRVQVYFCPGPVGPVPGSRWPGPGARSRWPGPVPRPLFLPWPGGPVPVPVPVLAVCPAQVWFWWPGGPVPVPVPAPVCFDGGGPAGPGPGGPVPVARSRWPGPGGPGPSPNKADHLCSVASFNVSRHGCAISSRNMVVLRCSPNHW